MCFSLSLSFSSFLLENRFERVCVRARDGRANMFGVLGERCKMYICKIMASVVGAD